MKTASVKQFVALRAALHQEKEQLVARLKEISAALAGVFAGSTAPAAAAAKPGRARKKRAPRAENAMSLNEAVAKVVAAKPLTKPEILKAVGAIGYTFTAKKPVMSLNTLLYTPGKFKKHPGGKWGALKK